MADKLQKFVQLIQNDQCLYNNTLQEYSRKDITDKAWTAIAIEMEWTIADCKEKWKNIRNGFVRSLKPHLNGSTTAKSKKPYYLHETMQFLMPYIRPVLNVEPTGNISLSDTEITMQHDESSFQSKPSINVVLDKNIEDEPKKEPVKRKRIPESSYNVTKKKKKHIVQDKEEYVEEVDLNSINEQKDEKTNDYREMFLRSLLPDVENLSDRNLRQFKIKTLVLLEQMLTEQEQQQTNEQYYDNSQNIHYSTNYDLSVTASRRSSETSVKNIVASPIDIKPSISPNNFF